MAVLRHGSVEVSTAGLANTETKAEVDGRTIFDTASLGKPAFA